MRRRNAEIGDPGGPRRAGRNVEAPRAASGAPREWVPRQIPGRAARPARQKSAKLELRFQGGSAGLRIHVAKKVRDCPGLLDALWKGELCLSGAALLVPHLTPENAEGLIRGSARKSTREIEEMLRGVAPRPAWEPGIRRVSAPVRAEVLPPASEPERTAEAPATAVAGAGAAAAGHAAPAAAAAPPARSVPEAAPPRRTPNVLEPATPETYNFRFSAGKEFRRKLERLAEVLGVADPVRQMGEILEKAVDCLLERKDPRQRRTRRLRREERRRSHLAPDVKPSGSAPEATPAATSPEIPAPAAKQRPARERATEAPASSTEREPVGKQGPRAGSRRPSAADWDDALERAGHQCEYVGRDGRRCTARAGLQPDHYPIPWSVSRSSEPEGIRVHCPAHNSLTAQEYFGEEHIDRKIAEARERRRGGRERGKDLGGGTGRG